MSDVVEDDVDERLFKLETDVAHIRVGMGELKSQVKDLRTELKDDINDLRTELKGDINGLRTELKGDIKELRSDITSIKEHMSAMRVDIVMTRVWMLCQSAVLLGVMARGFHWI